MKQVLIGININTDDTRRIGYFFYNEYVTTFDIIPQAKLLLEHFDEVYIITNFDKTQFLVYGIDYILKVGCRM